MLDLVWHACWARVTLTGAEPLRKCRVGYIVSFYSIHSLIPQSTMRTVQRMIRLLHAADEGNGNGGDGGGAGGGTGGGGSGGPPPNGD